MTRLVLFELFVTKSKGVVNQCLVFGTALHHMLYTTIQYPNT